MQGCFKESQPPLPERGISLHSMWFWLVHLFLASRLLVVSIGLQLIENACKLFSMGVHAPPLRLCCTYPILTAVNSLLEFFPFRCFQGCISVAPSPFRPFPVSLPGKYDFIGLVSACVIHLAAFVFIIFFTAGLCYPSGHCYLLSFDIYRRTY